MGQVKAINASNYVVPGYLVMFVFFAAAMSSQAIVQERQNHTMERLLASSVRKESILGGILPGTAIRGLIQIIIFWVVGILVFHVDLGLAPGAVIHPLRPDGDHVLRLRADAGDPGQDNAQRRLPGGDYLSIAGAAGRVLVALFPLPGMAAKCRQDYAARLGDLRVQ